jgi:HPt (histidine-containing phosphotransfer) domain-containing protein
MLEEMDDKEYLAEVLDIFLSESPKILEEMKAALQAGKTDVICKKAHMLKGSAGIIQAENLTSLLADIELIGKKGVINNELICLVDIAFYQYNILDGALRMYLEALK